MESRHHTGTWINKALCVLYILFQLVVLSNCHATEEQDNIQIACSEDEYEHDGFCCNRCPPGFKLQDHCKGLNLRSKCEKCSSGTFQDNMNHFPKCFTCTEACNPDSNEIEIAQCTHTQDRICGCETGYYKNVINDITMLCEACRKCGDGEIEASPCVGEKNTVCSCQSNYYRVAKGKCAPCKNCTSQCSNSCPPDLKTTARALTTGSPLESTLPTLVVGCLALGLFCLIILCFGVKHCKKRMPSLYSRSPVPCDPEKQVRQNETHICVQSKEDENILLAGPPDPVLPDCIPREIKTSEFIYFLLEIVPVSRFKEMVRRLNVSEQNIGRVERDHRAFAEAQYQMLMIWVENNSSGGKGILPRPLLQDCVDSLKDMNLAGCAESLEDKYA